MSIDLMPPCEDRAPSVGWTYPFSHGGFYLLVGSSVIPDCPMQSLMFGTTRQNHKVLGSVVHWVFVDMVDYLFGTESTSDSLRGHASSLLHSLSVSLHSGKVHGLRFRLRTPPTGNALLPSKSVAQVSFANRTPLDYESTESGLYVADGNIQFFGNLTLGLPFDFVGITQPRFIIHLVALYGKLAGFARSVVLRSWHSILPSGRLSEDNIPGITEKVKVCYYSAY